MKDVPRRPDTSATETASAVITLATGARSSLCLLINPFTHPRNQSACSGNTLASITEGKIEPPVVCMRLVGMQYEIHQMTWSRIRVTKNTTADAILDRRREYKEEIARRKFGN